MDTRKTQTDAAVETQSTALVVEDEALHRLAIVGRNIENPDRLTLIAVDGGRKLRAMPRPIAGSVETSTASRLWQAAELAGYSFPSANIGASELHAHPWQIQ